MTEDRIKLESDAKQITENQDKLWKKVQLTQQKTFDKTSAFYYFLASLSGGAFIISVTFIGSFKGSAQQGPMFFLYFGWICLVITVISALMRNRNHTSYEHRAIMRSWVKSLKAVEELKIRLYENKLFYNQEELDKNEMLDNIKKYDNVISHHKIRETVSHLMWSWAQKIADISFILGLISLLLFTISSLTKKA